MHIAKSDDAENWPIVIEDYAGNTNEGKFRSMVGNEEFNHVVTLATINPVPLLPMTCHSCLVGTWCVDRVCFHWIFLSHLFFNRLSQ
jgi:hypothetical protein